jgi:hypothetical protein
MAEIMQVTGHPRQHEIQRDRDSGFGLRVKISERLEKSSREGCAELSDRPSNANFFRIRRDHQFSVRGITALNSALRRLLKATAS